MISRDSKKRIAEIEKENEMLRSRLEYVNWYWMREMEDRVRALEVHTKLKPRAVIGLHANWEKPPP